MADHKKKKKKKKRMKSFRRSNRREDKELKHEYEFQGSCVLRDTSKLMEKAGTVSFFEYICYTSNTRLHIKQLFNSA